MMPVGLIHSGMVPSSFSLSIRCGQFNLGITFMQMQEHGKNLGNYVGFLLCHHLIFDILDSRSGMLLLMPWCDVLGQIL